MMDVGIKDVEDILLYLALDDGELHPPVIGNSCAHNEITQSRLFHIPFNKKSSSLSRYSNSCGKQQRFGRHRNLTLF